jgi:hypothetical protein
MFSWNWTHFAFFLIRWHLSRLVAQNLAFFFNFIVLIVMIVSSFTFTFSSLVFFVNCFDWAIWMHFHQIRKIVTSMDSSAVNESGECCPLRNLSPVETSPSQLFSLLIREKHNQATTRVTDNLANTGILWFIPTSSNIIAIILTNNDGNFSHFSPMMQDSKNSFKPDTSRDRVLFSVTILFIG